MISNWRHAFLCLACWGPALLLAEPVGSVFDLTGDVKIAPGGGAPAPAAKSGGVNEGDRITTGDKPSFVQINFNDNSIVKLGPNSDLTVTTKSPKLKKTGVLFKKEKLINTTELDLAVGDALIQVEGFKKKSSSFEVRTPTAVAGVRGTLFRRQFTPPVAEAPAQDACTCYRGRVEYYARDVERPKVEIVRQGSESGTQGQGNDVRPPAPLPPERREEYREQFDGGITPPPAPPPGGGGRGEGGREPGEGGREPGEGGREPGEGGPERGAENPMRREQIRQDINRDFIEDARRETTNQAAPTIQGGPVPLPGAGELPRPPEPPANP
ncbi:MAG: FecR domain-containing protein [Planctomycetes bacterium]|nr:FecR domain-containing protein [Planctomycetota bacterium]